MTIEMSARQSVLAFFNVPEDSLVRVAMLAVLDEYRDAVLREAANLQRAKSQERIDQEREAHGGVDWESIVMHDGVLWGAMLIDPDTKKA